MMRLPLWIRRLPHNLSTIRPRFKVGVDRHTWAIGIMTYLFTAPGDEDYLFHFDQAGIKAFLGPLYLGFLLVDTG